MPWAGQTWLQFVQEGVGGANFGTYNASPTAGQVIYPSLYQGNSFTPRNVPQRQEIRTADAGNRRRDVVAARHVLSGTLNTVLRPDEAAYWIAAVSSLTNDANGHPCLPSYSANFYDSSSAWRFLGGRCQSATLTSSAMQDYVTMSMNWQFQKVDPAILTIADFPQPAESNYSTLVPYEHVETAAHITLGATPITKYRTVTITFTNTLAPTFDENPYISDLIYSGRDMDMTFGPQYVNRTFRGYFETQTPLAFVAAFVRASPAHSLSIDMKAKSYIGACDDDLPLDGPGYQTISARCFFDPAAGTDYTTTVS